MIKIYHYCGEKYHVVQSINDSGEILYVVKSWLKSRQRWSYQVLTEFNFNMITNKESPNDK